MTFSPGKNLEIEALRGVAIVITLTAHLRLLFFWAPDWFESIARYAGLGAGVDLFFCISGFVIARSTLPFVPSLRTWSQFKAFALPFWIRRMWRLWPSALLWLAVYLLAAAYFNSTSAFGRLEDTINGTFAAAMQLANIYFPICVRAQNCGSNLVYWSLSLEEQFYVLFPIALFALRRKWLAIFFAILFALQFFIQRPTASLLWSVRTDAIACGVLLALLSFNPAYRLLEPHILNNKLLRPLLFLGSCFLLVRGSNFWPSLSPGVAVVCSAVLVWLAGYNSGYLMAAGKVRTLLVYLGSRSYAIYLAHEAVFRGTREIWHIIRPAGTFDGTYTLRFALTAGILTLVLAEINYRLVETPFRKRGKVIADKMRARFSQPDHSAQDQPITA